MRTLNTISVGYTANPAHKSARNLIHVYRPRLRCQPTPTETTRDGA